MSVFATKDGVAKESDLLAIELQVYDVTIDVIMDEMKM
jgi:hypothetical protein